MDHISKDRQRISDQLKKSYNSEESTTRSPQFLIIGDNESGAVALTAIFNSVQKSENSTVLNIFVDNEIDETKHKIPSQIDSIVLKGFSVEKLELIKADTQGKLSKEYIPNLIELIKSEDSVVEEKYKKKIAALKERRDPEGIEDDNDLEKAEGARGGKVIGHTKSGKPIYMNQNAMAEKHYTSKDHEEAAYKHLDHNKETGKDSNHHATQFDRHMDSSRHKKAQENVEKEVADSKKGKDEVIGKTESGKDVYSDFKHSSHKDFTDKDHYDAMKIHQESPVGSKEQASKHWAKRNRLQDKENEKNKPLSDGEAAATMSNKDFITHLKKSENLTPGEIQKARLSANLQKAYTPIFEDPDYLEKGKKAEVGEIRTWGGVKYVKHQDGWVTFNQKTGKGSVYGSDGKKKMDATLNHIGHYSEHSGKEVSKNSLKDSMSKLGYEELKAASRHMVGSEGQIAAHDELIDRAQRALPGGQHVKDLQHAWEILENVDDSSDVPGVLGKPGTITLDKDHKKEDSKTLVERYREIKTNHDNDPKQISHNDILDSMRRTHAASKNDVEEALVEHGESKIGFTSNKPKDSGLKLDGTDNTDEVLAKYNKGEISKLHVEHHFKAREGDLDYNDKEYGPLKIKHNALGEVHSVDNIWGTTLSREELKSNHSALLERLKNHSRNNIPQSFEEHHFKAREKSDSHQPTAKESLDHATSFHREESSNDNLNSKVRALHSTLADYYDGHRSLDKKDLHEALGWAKDRVENEETESARKKWKSVVNHLESKIKVVK